MRATLVTMRNAFADAWARPASLAAQMVVMVVNDAAWVVFWLLFFREVGSMKGWDAEQILVLQAVLTFGGGLALGVFRNVRFIGSIVTSGELDAVLALPVNPLVHLLVARIQPINLGDVAFGLGLFCLVDRPSPARLGLFVVLGVAAAAVLVGFLVLAGSTAFFIGRNEVGELGFHAALLLGSYPVDVFSGATRALLFTLVPAAFMATVPARLLDDFTGGQAVALLASGGAFLVAGATLFHVGLRRYTSGSLWNRA